MKNIETIKDVDFEIKWEGQPTGLWGRFLSLIHMNFTHYQITKDELIIKKDSLNKELIQQNYIY